MNKDQATREKFVEFARQADTVSDALFYVHHYNDARRRWAIDPKPTLITEEEIGLKISSRQRDEIIGRILHLSRKSCYVGEAYHEYKTSAESYDEAYARMKRENPGFTERVYGLVSNQMIFEMR